jgi:hypothetical protein
MAKSQIAQLQQQLDQASDRTRKSMVGSLTQTFPSLSRTKITPSAMGEAQSSIIARPFLGKNH